ncbi:MAG: low molecular weight protein arginine phosphatase [Gemmatimonadales bacterium]|nr:MAG: low molecular weight protein arginine phosphatase [Gemmatimonadales bacterium]
MRTRRLLFVCSGNTCRSPMAEVIARAVAAQHGFDFEFRSSGVMARDGSPASDLALSVAAAHGLDLSGHQARGLAPDDLEWADLVLGMTYTHVDTIRRQTPGIPTLPITGFLSHDHPGAGLGVDDPYGGTIEDYEKVWSTLEEALEAMLKRLARTDPDD